MYSNANEYTYPLVNQKPVRGSRARCNLTSKRSKTKFSSFTGSNCEWYSKHETLWEKFIKEHLLIGNQGFREKKLVSESSAKHSQQFHVDPRKCKGINIDIKSEGDKCVSISFVTSESNLHNLLPIDVNKYPLHNGELTNTVEDNGTTIKDRLKQNFDERNNLLAEKILESEKKLKDICIDTKSLEYLNCSKDVNVKTLETNHDTGKTKTDNVKPHQTCVDLPDGNSLKSASDSALSYSQCPLKTLQSTKAKRRFPPKEPIIRNRNLCTRAVSSKLLFKRNSKTLNSLNTSKYLEVGQGDRQKNSTFCVHRFEVLNSQKELPGQNFVKIEECLENKTNEKNCVEKSLKQETSCKNCTVGSSENKEKEKLHESSKCSSKDKSLLQVNKKKSDKSNVSTEKSDIKEYSETKLKSKKAVTKQSSEKESSLGGWFGFSKKFNIFNVQKQASSKEKDKKKVDRKADKKIVSDSSFTVSTQNIKRPNLKSRDKKEVDGKIVCDSWYTVSTVNIKKPPEKDRKRVETKVVSDSSFTASTVKSKKSNTAEENQSQSKTNMTDASGAYRRRNDDAGDRGHYIKYRHSSHKVRNHSHSPSKSKSKIKDAARHCKYCNRSKEKLEFLPDSVHRISDSAFFGPTLDETILNLIACLPSSILKRIGLFHESNPDLDKGEVTREDIVKCEKHSGEVKHRSKYYEDFRDEDDVLQWLNNEYIQLASELAEAKRNPKGKMSPEMYESREYVLNRLKDILKEKEYIEKKRERQKERKERRRDREED